MPSLTPSFVCNLQMGGSSSSPGWNKCCFPLPEFGMWMDFLWRFTFLSAEGDTCVRAASHTSVQMLPWSCKKSIWLFQVLLMSWAQGLAIKRDQKERGSWFKPRHRRNMEAVLSGGEGAKVPLGKVPNPRMLTGGFVRSCRPSWGWTCLHPHTHPPRGPEREKVLKKIFKKHTNMSPRTIVRENNRGKWVIKFTTVTFQAGNWVWSQSTGQIKHCLFSLSLHPENGVYTSYGLETLKRWSTPGWKRFLLPAWTPSERLPSSLVYRIELVKPNIRNLMKLPFK